MYYICGIKNNNMDKKNAGMKEKRENNGNVHPSLPEAFEKAMKISDEKERLVAIVNLIRGYRNPYNLEYTKPQYEAYSECLKGIIKQRDKIVGFIEEYFS